MVKLLNAPKNRAVTDVRMEISCWIPSFKITRSGEGGISPVAANPFLTFHELNEYLSGSVPGCPGHVPAFKAENMPYPVAEHEMNAEAYIISSVQI